MDPVPLASSSRPSQPKQRRGAGRGGGGRVNRLRYQARSCLDFGITNTLPPSMSPALTCLLLDFPASVPRLRQTPSFGSMVACFAIDSIVHSASVCLLARFHANSNSRSNSSSAERTRRMQLFEAEVENLVKSIVAWLTRNTWCRLPPLDLFSNVARMLAAVSFWSESTEETPRLDCPQLVLGAQDQLRQRPLEQPQECRNPSNAARRASAEEGLEVPSNRSARRLSAVPSSPLLSRTCSSSISAPICREEVRRHPFSEWTNYRQGGEPTSFKV